MRALKEKTHTFILRVWLEPREIDGAADEWRGLVRHVGSGRQRYLNNLNQIIAFIIPYLKKMGIKVSKSEAKRKGRALWKLAFLKRDEEIK